MGISSRWTASAAGVLVLTCLVSCNRGGRPDAPAVAARAWGIAGDTFEFTVSTTDPDGDNVAFRYRPDSGSETDWTGFVESGAVLGVTHVWMQAGQHRVNAQARDDRGGLSDWSADFLLSVLPSPGYPDRVVRSMDTPTRNVSRLAVSPDGERLYAVSGIPGELSVFDVATGELTGQITGLPTWNCDFALSPDEDLVYLGRGSQLLVLDAVDLSVFGSVPLDFYVGGVGASPAGDRVYITAGSKLRAISTETWEVVDSFRLTDGDLSGIIRFSPDGGVGYLTSRHILLVVDLSTCELLARVPIPSRGPTELIVSPDGSRVYALDETYHSGLGVYVINTSDMSISYGPVRPGVDAANDVALMPSGEFLIAVFSMGDSVAVYRTRGLSFEQSFAVPVFSYGAAVAVSPDGHRAFVMGPQDRVEVLGYHADQWVSGPEDDPR